MTHDPGINIRSCCVYRLYKIIVSSDVFEIIQSHFVMFYQLILVQVTYSIYEMARLFIILLNTVNWFTMNIHCFRLKLCWPQAFMMCFLPCCMNIKLKMIFYVHLINLRKEMFRSRWFQNSICWLCGLHRYYLDIK